MISEAYVQPVVPSPANTTNCASLANLASVFSSSGSVLFNIPSKMVLFTRSGLGELLISRTFSIHHYSMPSVPKSRHGSDQTYRLLVPQLFQGWNKRSDSPSWCGLDQESKPRKVAEDVGEGEEQIGRFEVRRAVVPPFQETKRVAKRVYGNHVACARFEQVVHLHDLARSAGQLHPRPYFSHMLFHDRLESTYAGRREEGIQGVAASTVHVVVYSSHDGIRRYNMRDGSASKRPPRCPSITSGSCRDKGRLIGLPPRTRV